MRLHDEIVTTMWWNTVTSDTGYTKTYLTIRELRERLVLESIGLCTSRPEYYGPPDLYLALANQKLSRYFDSYCSNAQMDFTINWQHYDHSELSNGVNCTFSYCSHSIESIDNFSKLRSANKFLTKLTRKLAKSIDRYDGPSYSYQRFLDDPRVVYDQLKKDGVRDIGLNSPDNMCSVFAYASELGREPLTFLTDEQMKEVS